MKGGAGCVSEGDALLEGEDQSQRSDAREERAVWETQR